MCDEEEEEEIWQPDSVSAACIQWNRDETRSSWLCVPYAMLVRELAASQKVLEVKPGRERERERAFDVSCVSHE